jgi:tight adherence protein B
LDAVPPDAADPVSTELYRALAETRIGAELTDALDRLANRMDSENMRWTTMAIRIQQQVGGNLGETLRTTATTLREREQLRRMVRGLSAEGRLSAYILIGLPIGLFGYMLLTNHDYIALLWTTGLGWLMLAVALVGMAVGSFWMSRVVKVEV